MSSKRFTPDQRLRHPRQFKATFAEGQRLRGPLFTVVWIPNSLQHARLGLAVAKRQVKRAVDRNRIKRSIREQLRLTQDRLANLDLIFVAHNPTQKLSRAELRNAVVDSLKRLRQRSPMRC